MLNCTFESGKQTSHLRHAVVDVLLIDKKTILLTRRADSLREGGKWCLPGGYMDRDETAVEAAMRELHEEAGYTCEIYDLFTILDEPNRKGDDRQNISFVFLAKPIEKVGEIDPSEVSEMQWFPLDALPDEADMAFDHFDIIWRYIQSIDVVLKD